jgi:hypothetical protein
MSTRHAIARKVPLGGDNVIFLIRKLVDFFRRRKQ